MSGKNISLRLAAWLQDPVISCQGQIFGFRGQAAGRSRKSNETKTK